VPICNRCGRMQATAELRRTQLGYLCKDNGPGTRCWTIAREHRQEHRQAERRRTGTMEEGTA
jgi:hypothetical protein